VTLDSPTDTAANGVCLEETTRLHGTGGHYTGRLYPEWQIWGPNGGYLATLALRAAAMCADIPRPAGIQATFLRSPRFDEVTLDVVTLKRGRRTEVFAVTMSQDGRPVLAAQVQTAAVAPGYETQPAPAPDVAAPDASTVLEPGGPYPFWANLSRRSTSDGGEPRMREWDAEGHLVATGASQLCCVPAPP
jgi:hypothetical protein